MPFTLKLDAYASHMDFFSFFLVEETVISDVMSVTESHSLFI